MPFILFHNDFHKPWLPEVDKINCSDVLFAWDGGNKGRAGDRNGRRLKGGETERPYPPREDNDNSRGRNSKLILLACPIPRWGGNECVIMLILRWWCWYWSIVNSIHFRCNRDNPKQEFTTEKGWQDLPRWLESHRNGGDGRRLKNLRNPRDCGKRRYSWTTSLWFRSFVSVLSSWKYFHLLADGLAPLLFWQAWLPMGDGDAAGFSFCKSSLGSGFRIRPEERIRCFAICLNGYIRIYWNLIEQQE